MFVEVNFDGLIGPSHNYAGLSLGNVASASNRGAVSSPRAAALQGIAKMRDMISLGLPQGVLLPQERPAAGWLRDLGFGGDDDAVCAAAWRADPGLLRNAFAASAMWTANAAAVSPAPDTADGRCHLSVANLATMPHRGIEATATERQLRLAFADQRHFQVHGPVPTFGDEGAANMMRVAGTHEQPGVEVFVYGERQPGGFPARQDRRSCEAVARRHGLAPNLAVFARQSDAVIQAGAFHNDVVAVANEDVLLTHEQAFADPPALYDALRTQVPGIRIVEVPAATVSLADAIGSYMFNSQLVTLPGGGPGGEMTLIAPIEASENAAVAAWLAARPADCPIADVRFLDVRESMRNGGGPACLRLRVAVDDAALAAIDPRFMVDERKCDALSALVEQHWPGMIGPEDLGSAGLWGQCRAARRALLALLTIEEDL